MNAQFSIQSILRHLLVLLLLSGLGACRLDLGNNDSPTAADSTLLSVDVSGSVGDGPVTGATVTVYGSDGAVLGTVQTDSTAGFRSTLRIRGNQYPVTLLVSGGVDLVTGRAPDFVLESVLLKPSDRVANINPFTSVAVALARRLPGGVSAANVASAQGIVRAQLGFGLDEGLVADPISSTIDADNVAALVKSSEALGELVRRVRNVTGRGTDQVVAALAADLVDGHLDGLGGTGTDGRLSAVASVVSSQVLVESLSNSLRVGGVPVAGVMDASIRSTTAGIADSQLTGSVRINAQLLSQARLAVAAARVLDDSSAVQDIAGTLTGLRAGSSAAQVASVLPTDSTNALRTAVQRSTQATTSDIDSINHLVFAGSDTGSSTTTASSSTSGGTTTTTSTSSSTSGGTTTTTSTSSSTSGGTTTTTTTTTVGSFTLNWTAPSARSDGTALSLSQIGGYRIRYGASRGSYSNVLTINNAATQAATVGSLVAGRAYYLVMSTFDVNGLESRNSAEVTKYAQ